MNMETVFDSAVSGEYVETLAGKTHTFTQRSVRYVRDYLNGSTANSGNHWTEIEVWGTATTAYVGDYFEWNGSPQTMTRYYSAGGTRVAVRNSNGNGTNGLVYLFGDHLGSVSLTADPVDGDKLSELRYKAWGETRHTLTNAPTNRRYTGQAEEAGIGLYYYGARFYDPALGRFASPDSIIPQNQGSQAWDHYAYANNNPIRYNDPTGHWIESLLDIASIAYDVYDISQNGLNWGSGLSLAADVASLLLPGITGGGAAVRALAHVDDVADAYKASETAGDVLQAANQVDNVTIPSISTPNGGGRLGGPAHQSSVSDIFDNIEKIYGEGYSGKKEYKIETPGGQKQYRYADVAVLDPGDNPVGIYQVGRATQGGLPVARERYAISDIYEYSSHGDVPIHFIPYNKVGPQ